MVYILLQDGYDPTEDTCFAPPNWVTSHTGVSAVGYELWTGVECKFIILYRINADTIEKNVDCIVKSKHIFSFVYTLRC